MTTNRKKILFVITKSNFGGAQRYVYELATSLSKDMFEVTVALGGDGSLKQKLIAAKIQTCTIPSFARDINLWKEVLSLFELRDIIKRVNPDIIHLNSSKAGGSGAFIARLLGVPYIIFTAHGFPFFESRNLVWKSIVWILSWITTLLAHSVILVSAYDDTHAHLPFIKRKSTIIRTALPRINFLSRASARNILFPESVQSEHEHETWLVTNAELTPNKNLLAAISAVATHNVHNPQSKIFYSIIGNGEQEEMLRTYIHTHGLESEIHLTGYVPEARVYLKAFDIFILPSLKEGMPYALLEAGAAEIPSIASSVGGIPEIITHHETGLLVEPKNQQSLESALHLYTKNVALRKSHAQALKIKIDESFDLKTMLEKTIAVYTRN